MCFEFPRDKSPDITIKIRTDISHPGLISPRTSLSLFVLRYRNRTPTTSLIGQELDVDWELVLL